MTEYFHRDQFLTTFFHILILQNVQPKQSESGSSKTIPATENGTKTQESELIGSNESKANHEPKMNGGLKNGLVSDIIARDIHQIGLDSLHFEKHSRERDKNVVTFRRI